MDQKEKPGNKGPTMTASEQVNSLRRWRDSKALSSGRDKFVKNILDAGLESEWIRQMSDSNPYDR